MDHDAFDRLTRLLGTPGSRRAALGALLDATLLGAAESAVARKPNGSKGKARRKRQDKGKIRRGTAAQPGSGAEPSLLEPVVAEAANCLSPGPSSNMNGCNFNDEDFSADDLSGSKMVETTFRDATLVGTNLSSSNMKAADFRGANLCGANLRSSTLTNANFRNANLTKADLRSSGCNGLKTNTGTTFCQTTMCNGTLNNSDCPGADPDDVCCAAGDCAQKVCQAAGCEDGLCAYVDQDDGEPGTECPNQCCDLQCCPDGQKCCSGDCIPNASCCAADCAADEKCCGAECIGDTICCTDGDPGVCPPNQQCCPGSDIPAVDDGGTCKQAIGQTCTDPNNPELDCCFPDFCCQNDGDPGPQCKAGSGKPCVGNNDCCNNANLFCGTVGGQAVCCITVEGRACNPSVTPCCSPLVCNDDFECEAP